MSVGVCLTNVLLSESMKLKCLAACVAVLMLAVGSVTSEATVYLALDNPQSSAGRDFPISGTALNSDGVHVWTFMPGFENPPVFLGYAWTNQPDGQRQTDTGHFRLLVRNAPIGNQTVVVYAHDPTTNTFPTQVAFPITVHACQPYVIAWPFTGPGGSLVQVSLPYCA